MGRVLGRIRLSRMTDESTSVDRQREAIEAWALMHDHQVIGWAVDTDVSGAVSPFDTEHLGPWLTPERAPEWDILVAWKLDRLARQVVPLNALFGWIAQNDKSLACVVDQIDLSTWVGRMVANVIAGVAEGELEAIKTRTRASRAFLRKKGRWSGGTVPYGYRVVKLDDGWAYELDEEKAPLVREIADRAQRHESIRSISEDLNAREIPSPRGGEWTPQTVTRMLKSRWIIGQAEHQGKPVPGDDGLPLQIADPCITLAQWSEIQAVLADRSRPRKRSNGTGILLNIAHCQTCKEPLWLQVQEKPERNQSYRYWRCSGATKKRTCNERGIPANMLESFVEEQLLDEIGDIERTVQVFVPSEIPSDEADRVEEAITRLRKESDLGLYEGSDDEYLARLSDLVSRKKELSDLPGRPARWEPRGTGETYRDAWSRMDDVDRRELLVETGIKVPARMVSQGVPSLAFHVPADILARAVPGYAWAP